MGREIERDLRVRAYVGDDRIRVRDVCYCTGYMGEPIDRPGTAGVVWRTVGDAVIDIASGRMKVSELEFSDARWPAHLHIDLLPEARGRGAGRRLVKTWFAVLRGLRTREGGRMHAQTMVTEIG